MVSDVEVVEIAAFLPGCNMDAALKNHLAARTIFAASSM